MSCKIEGPTVSKENKPPFQLLLNSTDKFSCSWRPYLPYRVVVHMATSCLAPFLQAAHDLVAPSDQMIISEKSCIHNLNALMVIFSGAVKAKIISEKLRYMTTVSLSAPLQNSKEWNYTVVNLFTGEFLVKFRQRLTEDENTRENREKFANSIAPEIITKFFRHTEPIVKESLLINKRTSKETEDEAVKYLKNSWSKLGYSFNKNVLGYLLVDLHLNNRYTNEKVSFVYYINIMMPDSYENAGNKDCRTYHAFLIEQFSGQNGQSLYRIYSSWEKSISILEYFQKRGYAESNEGCLTYHQMKGFLEDFKPLVCESPEDINRAAIREKLFGYASYGDPPISFFDDKNCVLKGLSLRYEVCKIDPTQSLNNFREFIEKMNGKSNLLNRDKQPDIS